MEQIQKYEQTPRELNFGWMKKSFFRWIAFGFGSGLVKKAPGTWGTLFGWWSWFVVSFLVRNDLVQAIIIFLAFALGVYVCQRIANETGVQDHGGVVWDEIVAFWLVLFVMTPLPFVWQLAAFIIFRFFDIVKPWPINFFDEKIKNGFGVMWDDMVAAIYTLFVIAVAVRVLWM